MVKKQALESDRSRFDVISELISSLAWGPLLNLAKPPLEG